VKKPFTIISFALRREVEENLRRAGYEADDDAKIHDSLLALAQFLEKHDLCARMLLKDGRLIDGQAFVLRSCDLTDEGVAVIRAGFGAWEEKGYPASNLGPLERAYKKVLETKRKS
jgi:hypothetical protein